MAILFLHGTLWRRKAAPLLKTYTDRFIYESGLRDAQIIAALRQLEYELIHCGALHPTTPELSKLRGFWPTVGGDAQLHSFNFVNPKRNNLGFNGSPLHSAEGVATNGQSQWAASDISPADALGNTVSIGMYLKEVRGGQYHMGTYQGNGKYVTLYQQGNTMLAAAYANEVQADLSGQGNGLGFRAVTRSTNSQVQVLLKNGAAQVFDSPISLPPPAQPLYIGGLNNNGGPSNFSAITFNCAFAAPALSPVIVLGVRAAIDHFNITLNRAA